MLYPFMSINGEGREEEGQDMVNPPSKSLHVNVGLLQEANLEMESHFGII